MHPYYEDKLNQLRRMFGQSATLGEATLTVGDRVYCIVDDVIVTLSPDHRPGPRPVRSPDGDSYTSTGRYAPSVQETFSNEWARYPELLEEYRTEVDRYFDLLPMEELADEHVVDLGCGIGRWAHSVSPRCRSITLVDFSEAIYIARTNMRDRENAIFVMADLLDLPFVEDAFDVAYCFGVLHHLPVDALDALRELRSLAPALLIYIYYDLDNRPPHFRFALNIVTPARRLLCKVNSSFMRNMLTWIIALFVYRPILLVGVAAERFRRNGVFPLVDGYRTASLRRIRQDVYDRFFTPIEQRFTRAQIHTLEDTFHVVTISDQLPFWHFLCRRG